MALLTARALSKTYRRKALLARSDDEAVHALSEASLTIEAGSIVGLIGESGSGKSTLARCLAAREVPDSGEVLISGRSLHDLTGNELRTERRKVQLVFEDSVAAFNPRFTLEEIVAEPLAIAGLTKRQWRGRVLSLMAEVGLPIEWLERRPAELSGGQRQRLGIARGLAADARILILDEALSGLDPPVQAKMIALLVDLVRASGVGLLFISHDLRLAAEISSEIAVMRHGRIVEHANTEDLFLNPQQPYTRSLLSAMS